MFAYTLCMSKRYLLYIMNVSKISFLHYDRSNLFFVCVRMSQRCLLFSLWMSQRCYGCLKDVFCTLWLLKYVFCTLWMSQRCLLYIMIGQICFLYVTNVSKMSFFHYGCLKDVMNVSKISFLHYECLKEVFVTLWSLKYVFCMLRMSQRCLLFHYGCLKDVMDV